MKRLLAAIAFGLTLSVILLSTACRPKENYRTKQGIIFGTLYNITYASDKDLSAVIDQALQEVNQVANPFDSTSLLYAINNNLTNKIDTTFHAIYSVAQRVNRLSGGAYDVTIGPLVNAWGFGFEEAITPSATQIDSLLQLVGMDEITISEGVLTKSDSRMKLDFASVAKGYGADHVAAALREHGVSHYLVEIGGEIAYQGVNPEQKPWHIGINKPEVDSLGIGGDIEEIVTLTGHGGLATSGNYRNYKVSADGKMYGHTISPRSGYPIQTDVLSATVIAPTSAEADALATAFMALGYEASADMRAKLPREVSYMLILPGADSLSYRIVQSEGFPALPKS